MDRAVEITATDRPDTFVVRVGGRDQSLVDLGDPTYLGFDYVGRMGQIVDAIAPPGRRLRVVHVGGAGLTLPRYVAHTRPGSRQIVLEPDEQLTRQVRDELPLPARSGIRVRATDGRPGLLALPDASADLLLLDAYDDGRVPSDLVTVECFAQVARVLSPAGVLVANIADRAPFGLTRVVVAGLRASLRSLTVSSEPATLKGRRAGNLLVVAGLDDRPLEALSRGARSSSAPYRVMGGAEVQDRFGGGEPARDDTGVPAPDPTT